MPEAIAKRRLARQQAVPVAEKGRGVFSDVTKVQDPAAAITRGLLASASTRRGLAVAKQTGRRTYKGIFLGGPQRFTRPPSEIDAVTQVNAARVKANARRSSSGTRGRPR